MREARQVTMIPPTVGLYTAAPLSTSNNRRVAGYARVSTENDEQLTSYDAQVEYYTKYIKEHEGWEFVGLYSDEGRSGTSIKMRPGFQKLIADAMEGKVDLIITKSISRFARNTVDSISTVRQLKSKGVEVFFEKDGLWTFDPSAELTITILSSIAQEESRNLSENIKWSKRNSFAEGRISMPYKRFLGYDKGEDGLPKINEEQAELVRRIYKMFIDGMNPTAIAKQLTKEGIPTPGGKTNWLAQVVESILTNERYKGDALLQKTYCACYLSKKMKTNEGEVPQYYVTDSHPAIVSRELFDYVQTEMERRKGTRVISTAGCFAGRVICGECGSIYGAKVWHSNSKYRRIVWRCNGKYDKKGTKCTTPHFYEDNLKTIFIQAMNSFISDRESIITSYQEAIKNLTDTAGLKHEQGSLERECDIVLEMMRKMVTDNAHMPMEQSIYTREYDALVARYNSAKDKLDGVIKEIEERNSKSIALKEFLRNIKSREDLLIEFDEKLWNSVIQELVIHSATRVTFVFKDGTELPWWIK